MTQSHKLLFPLLLVFFEMATYLSSDMYLPALPTVMGEFALSHSEAQWTLTSWFLGAISVQLLLGPLSDRFGRKIILCIGGVIFVVSTLICGLASNYHLFLIARFIQGTGVSFMSVPGYASIHELFEQKEAIKILALLASISVLAPAFGPLVGSFLLLWLSWRYIFFFLVVWGVISVVTLIKWMPESLPIEKRHALHLPQIIKNYRHILSNFRFIAANIAIGMLFCAFVTWIAAGPFLVIDDFHQSPTMFGVYQTLIFISYILGNHLVKQWIDTHEIKKLVQVGLYICLAIGIIGLIITYAFPRFLIGMIAIYVIYSFGSAFTFAPLNRIAIESIEAPMGAKMAVFSMLLMSFASLGSVLVGLFYNNTLLSLALMIFASIVISFVAERLVRY